MARLGVSKKKKSPRTTVVSQLKKELQSVSEQLESCKRELAEGRERETATGEILRVIASSPTDIQPVFDTIAESSMRLCGALFSSVYRYDGELIHMVAHRNYPPVALELSERLFPTKPTRRLFTGRAILERAVVNVPDVQSDREWHSDADRDDVIRLDQEVRLYHGGSGFRSVLSVPMLRGANPIGAITVWHPEVGPFSDKQIALLKTFADQAVIAIENVRLFKEIQERNAELREALEHQTATSEVLGIISRSPTDVQPVLDAIVESATRVCGIDDATLRLREGNTMVVRSHFGPIPFPPQSRPISRGFVGGRAIIERRTIHVHDLAAEVDTEYPEVRAHQQQIGFRTDLETPLMREGIPIGVIGIRRMEVRPFSEKQIKLLETFASQAVIAIENVRLFKEIQERNAELREALEHRTA